MASRIYTTEGIVLARSGVGEASLLVSLFTKDFGRVVAKAQSARASGSKLRYGLEPLTQGRFSLVKGKAGWRIVGVGAEGSLIMKPGKASQTLGHITALLSRLLPPHEAVPTLYALVVEDLRFVAGCAEDNLRSAECVTVLHVLAHLGYLPATQELQPFSSSDPLTESLAESMTPLRSRAVNLINQSLSASGL